VGAPVVYGLQGRYYIPLIPLLLFAILPNKPVIDQHFLKIIPVIGLVWIFYLLFLSQFRTYYVVCGSPDLVGKKCFLPFYRSPIDDMVDPLEIKPGHSFEQTFTPHCDSIDKVRLWTSVYNKVHVGTLIVNIRDYPSNQLIDSAIIKISDITDNEWFPVSMAPVDLKPGSQLVIEVMAGKANDTDGISLGILKDGDYPEGQLMIDGEPAGKDLMFIYGCR
jgi:hypothetical protein